MKRFRLGKLVPITMIAFLLCWTSFPTIALASFITPGTPITPGDAITPGEPINGGEFIVPGEVYDPGETYQPGDQIDLGDTGSSGTPIIESSPMTQGIFIIPNAPISPSYVEFANQSIMPGDPMKSGDSVQTGENVTGGNGVQSGSAVNGGAANGDGSSINGGNSVENGDAINSGDQASNGEAATGGNAIDGGNANGNGQGGTNGDAVNSQGPIQTGDGMNGGDSTTGGKTDGSGNGIEGSAGSGGSEGSEGQAGSGEPPSLLNLTFNTTNDDQGLFGRVTGFLKDTKRYVVNFADDVAQGVTSIYAGFRFNELADGKYSVYGKNQLGNKISNWFYDRYRQYSYNGDNVHFGPHSRRIGEGRYNAFLNSKGLASNGGLLGHVASSTKNAINNSWNVFSKGFWKPSNSLKLGGPAGVILNSAGSIYKHSDGFSNMGGLASTDFAASFTTDAAVGIASTAIGSAASSMATGALAGSVVPGVGTVVGAVAGLGAGLLTTYLVNGTATGRRIKKATTEFVKKGYDKAVEGVKWVGDKVSSAFSKLGGLFS
ncbi:hypothetical protein [Salinibacillus xinjiangensis]|uniref:Uncharacterized protein n=1 Tax=Salinibacillus xinjiangensis TaxID=1229268 RepID=A0A6G1X8Q0_9BACI|nr:hypothetical protein [Salinibacillus xinjiangensis]MRG87381.1 hypothetical protein [Salinibacillus xinjiangensis]